MEGYKKAIIYNSRKADAGTIWLLFFLFGWSYGSLDKIGLQILYYFTFGGLGLWAFIRLFTLSSSIREHNIKIAIECGLNEEDMMIQGLY